MIDKDTVRVAWDGFESTIGMMMYYVGITNNTDANSTSCGEFVSTITLHSVMCRTDPGAVL